jgi:beta-phosphoglucomutase
MLSKFLGLGYDRARSTHGVFPATLFDFNGVLVDDEHVHLEAFRDAVRPLGLTISDQEYWDEYLGFDDVGAFTALLRKAGLDASLPRVLDLVEAKRPLYMARAETALKAFPGAAALVRRQAARGPVGVVSGALRDEIEFGLVQLGVADVVRHITSAEDTAASKPDPEGYRLGIEWLLESLSLEQAQRALVIEDSLDGIAAAKAAGLPVVAVAHSYGRAELESSGADMVVATIGQIDDAKLTQLYQELYG